MGYGCAIILEIKKENFGTNNLTLMNLIINKDEYTADEINQMRIELAETEYADLNKDEIIDVLLDGHIGWNNEETAHIIDTYKRFILQVDPDSE